MERSGAKTPRRRKRARLETATATTPPPTSRVSPGGTRHRTRNSASKDDAEPPRVVWRDSPAEKQVRVSGTGKLAQQQEVQSFVGRLTRASLESPPTNLPTGGNSNQHHDDDTNADHGVKRRSLTRLVPSLMESHATGEPNPVSRHILFSPEAEPAKKRSRPDAADSAAVSSPQRSVRRASSRIPSDSQDELALLDQIDARLSRESPQPHRQTPDSVDNINASAAITQATAPAAPPGRSHYVTPPRHQNIKQADAVQPTLKTPPVVVQQKLEFESPDFTEESWDLLDQLEFQASQQIQMKRTSSTQLSQSQCFSQQVLPPAPAPRPLRTTVCAAVASGQSTKSFVASSTQAHPMVRPVSVQAKSHASEPASPLIDKRLVFEDSQGSAAAGSHDSMHPLIDPGVPVTTSETFKRLLVLELDRDPYHRCVILRALDEDENHVELELREDWYDTNVDAGDTIHLILSERDSHGFFSQDVATQTRAGAAATRMMQRVIVDNEHHLIIAHPDILVSPTRVTTSFGCLRRAILQETLSVSRPTNQKALLGTLKHELFQRALMDGQQSVEFMLAESRRIVSANVLQLIESNLSEETALLELGKVMQDYQKWLIDSRRGGVQLNEPPSSAGGGTKVVLRQILAVEEMLWSVKWGVKGATDASVQAAFSTSAEEVVLPLELKTGSKMYAGVEHQGQVILYTLLLNERYQQRCQDGLLMYVPGIETNRIAAMASHVRGLIIARNKFATAMARVKAMGSATSSHQQQALPPMLRRRRDCERCFQIDECVLHHAAVENGSEESSALEDLFHRKVGHLDDDDREYFRKWNRLIDLEHQNADKHLRALWLQPGTKRERDPECLCIAQLRLISDEPAPRGPSASTSMRMLRFQRDKRAIAALASISFLEHRFRVDDRVILSVESLDEKKLLVHLARGRIAGLAGDSLLVETFQSIPSIVATGRSVVGAAYTWRVDKDAIVSGLSRAKENLVKLFIGPAPEEIIEGTATHLRADLLSNAVVSQATQSQTSDKIGDIRRRKLVVHLLKPRFRSARFTELLSQRQQARPGDALLVQRASQLHDEFSRLNIDQQRGVVKVLNSLDYALILGMPGTGKTSAIAFTVKVLIHLGFSVLITSYTHSAVDNLLLKLLDNGFPMIRVGNSAQVHPLLAPYTLENSVGKSMSVQDVELRIKEAKLVGCTCLGVNSNVLFSKRRFDFCIVDEATQTTEPVVLGPLRCADTFVLVGDHYQLPPLVANAQAKKEGMDVSLFRRLSEAHPEATQQLSYQYRMNSDIMTLANRLVYADKLKCGSHAVATNGLTMTLPRVKNASAWPLQVLQNGHGVQFLDTDAVPSVSEVMSNTATNQGRGRKLENVVEARIVAGLVHILVAGGIKHDEIAVIAPFRSQVALILHQIRALLGPTIAIEVSTIDKYQGKDKDVVLVSFVRCNPERQVGELLTDWRRINVALTRAKQKLILVGSKETLRCGSSLFHVLTQLIDERQWNVMLPQNALAILDDVVSNLSLPGAMRLTRRHEVEPEREPDREAEPLVMRMSRGENHDIEGLVPSAVPVQRGTRAPPMQQHPITRDILGGGSMFSR